MNRLPTAYRAYGPPGPYPPFSDLDSFGGLMITKRHAGDSSSTVAKDGLQTTSGRFGSVETVATAPDPVAGTGKGIAMWSDEDAPAAIVPLHGTQCAGGAIGVGRARAVRS